jgi:IclR family pca regulon transcriptional regulator
MTQKVPVEDKEFMTTLAKGLAVLGSFDKERPTMTLSQAAQTAGLSRATARRILRTLTQLGYVIQKGRDFALSSGILKLGYAYLATQNWIEQASGLMRQLSEEFHESCSAAILDGTEIVYVARIPAGRIISGTIAVGTRLPAFHTALGRIQLGFLDSAELWRRLKALRVDAFTPSTITDPQALFDRVREDHAQGFCHRRRRARAGTAIDCRADRRSYKAKRSRRSISAPIRPVPHATKCASAFLPDLRSAAERISASII